MAAREKKQLYDVKKIQPKRGPFLKKSVSRLKMDHARWTLKEKEKKNGEEGEEQEKRGGRDGREGKEKGGQRKDSLEW
jgi:hypothetical protein